MSEARPEEAALNPEQRLALALTSALVRGQGMNEFLHMMLEEIRAAFQGRHAALFDFDEHSGSFELLYFCGYPPDARSVLRKRMPLFHLDRALLHPGPFWAEDSREQLLLPLYFQDALEAVLLLEGFPAPLEPEDARWRLSAYASRFVGLLMSSSRLPVNQRAHPAGIADLERAREVQSAYLPTRHPVTDGYETFGYNRSSSLVGGDYFDYFEGAGRSVQCIIADACGHGLAAALVMSTFRGLLRSEIQRDADVQSLFVRLNRHLFTGGELIQYLTSVFLDYDEDRRIIRYLNAGHFDPLLIHPDGTFTSMPGGGPPLGMFHQSSYPMGVREVVPGDLLLLFTDGLAEHCSPEGEFFGLQGILAAARARRRLPLPDLAREILEEADRFSRSRPAEDDLTLFLMRFR